MKYYLKKAGNQELGSVRDGSLPSRGRYLYISKNKDVLNQFPPLSEVVRNDSALLPVVPIYLKKKVYCNYVYHNDKLIDVDGTRNEYRIYLNSALEKGTLLFNIDDIVVFKKDFLLIDDASEEVYFIDLIKKSESEVYDKYDQLIQQSPVRGGHCIYDGVLEEFEKKIEEIKKQTDIDSEIDTQVTTKIATMKSDKNINDLFNQVSFRDFVLVGYENLCAITRSSIRWNGLINLEAAHIRPKSHGGLFMPNNGLALSRDMHWAFDKGFFTIDDDMKILVHKDIKSEYLHSFNGNLIFIPSNEFFIPDMDNLRYHRENVFGLFKMSGRL